MSLIRMVYYLRGKLRRKLETTILEGPKFLIRFQKK